MTRSEPSKAGESAAPRKPIVAALLSLLTPGLGQLYNGQLVKALVFFVVVSSVWLAYDWTGLRDSFRGFVVGLALLLGGLLVLGYSIVDAFQQARRRSHYRAKAYNRWYVYLIPLLMMGTLQIALPHLAAMNRYRSYHLSSPSMQPALRPGDHVMVRLGALEGGELERGEIVVYAYPPDPSRDFMHRVVGLPGETLSIVDGRIFVDGEALEEPYVASSEANEGFVDPRLDNLPSTVVPERHCFVIGDDRHQSHDSRSWGPLPIANLRGRPLYVYWSSDRSRIGKSLVP